MREAGLLAVNISPRTIDLRESLEDIFSSLIDVRTTCIFGKVFIQRHLKKLF